MAIFHLGVNSIKRSMGGKTYSAALKHDYVCREGIYAERKGLEFSESGNMPEWAKDNSREFWESADAHARANGRLLTELEYALPHELNREEQIKLAQDFAEKMTTVEGGHLPYTMALHSPDGDNLNDHVHLEIAETINDGHARDAETWFKRHDSKAPEISGAEKTREMLNKDFVEKAREAWADQCNRALAAAGHDVRITHLSLEAQGIERIPEIHVGYVDPARPEIHAERLARNNEIKAINAEMAKAEIGVELAQVDLTQARAELVEINATLARAVQQHERMEHERATVERSFAEHGNALANKLQGELDVFTRGLSAESTRLNSELSSGVEKHSGTEREVNRQLASAIGQHTNAKFREGQGVRRSIDELSSACKQIDVGLQQHEEDLGRISAIGQAVGQHREFEGYAQEFDKQIRGEERGLTESRGNFAALELTNQGINSELEQASQRIADASNRVTEASRGIEEVRQARDLANKPPIIEAVAKPEPVKAPEKAPETRQDAPGLREDLKPLYGRSQETFKALTKVARQEREIERLPEGSFERGLAETKLERLQKEFGQANSALGDEARKLQAKGFDISPALAPLGPDLAKKALDTLARERAQQTKQQEQERQRTLAKSQSPSRGHGGHSR
ncbi:MAG: MobA/MobL family protein [Desulfovibrionaceae bacterium]|nr:MobA/MobL family protein [Desulfovibrionaceae bacterium]